MGMIREFFAMPMVKRIVVLLLFVLLLYSLRHMLNMLLLVFLVTYIMNSLQGFLTKKISRLFPIHPNIVSILLYVVIISGMVVGISNYVPQIISQVVEMFNTIIKFLNSNQDDPVVSQISDALNKIEYKTYVDQSLLYIGKLGKILEIILIVIILSLFFLLQKTKVVQFTRRFKTSKIGWIYDELAYFGEKFVSSFGKVIEVQLVIALFNTVITMVVLWVLGFPYLFALGIMVLLLSLIPVAGVVISFLPIGLIGYQTGGWSLVIWTVALIVLIHALETYLLNPRLMASKTKLPMFYTFVILVFSQHFFGIWGLIIGIPIFMFLMDILEVSPTDEKLPGSTTTTLSASTPNRDPS